MSKEVMTNKFGVKSISMNKNVHCFCPLGQDHYCASVSVSLDYPTDFTGEEYVLLDYCDVDTMFRQIDGEKHILEEVGQIVKEYFIANTNLPDDNISISVYCDDAVHLPVSITF